MSTVMHLRLQRPLAANPGAPPSTPPGATFSWLLVETGTGQRRLRQGDLAAAGVDAQHARLQVYLPGQEVLLTRIVLPAGRRSQLREALPYALEEDLIEDVDSLHCALGPKLPDGAFVAAVIRRARLEEWLQLLHEAGLHPRSLLPDSLLLPWQEGHWSIACEPGMAYLRRDSSLAWACHPDLLPVLLERQFEDSAPPQGLDVYGCDTGTWQDIPARKEIELVRHDSAGSSDLLTLAMQYGLPVTELNLLQGEYAPRNRTRQRLRPWYTSAALAAGLLLLVLAGNIHEYYSLKKQNRQVAQQIEQVFRQTFPDVKRLVNARSQMRNRLLKLEQTASGSDADFSMLLARIAPLLAQTPGLQLQNLRYQAGRLDLQLEVRDLQTLEDLQNRLAASGGLKVELKSANASDNKVQGRLLISRSNTA